VWGLTWYQAKVAGSLCDSGVQGDDKDAKASIRTVILALCQSSLQVAVKASLQASTRLTQTDHNQCEAGQTKGELITA
jgi:hypothetical protein